jgi:hypothetical protein
MVDNDRNLRRLPLLWRCSSSSAAQGMDGAHRCGSLGGEERGWGKNGIQGKGLDRSRGFYTSVVDSVLVVSHVGDWTAGRCFLDGVVSCVHGCDRLGRWCNVAGRSEPFSVRVHG